MDFSKNIYWELIKNNQAAITENILEYFIINEMIGFVSSSKKTSNVSCVWTFFQLDFCWKLPQASVKAPHEGVKVNVFISGHETSKLSREKTPPTGHIYILMHLRSIIYSEKITYLYLGKSCMSSSQWSWGGVMRNCPSSPTLPECHTPSDHLRATTGLTALLWRQSVILHLSLLSFTEDVRCLSLYLLLLLC